MNRFAALVLLSTLAPCGVLALAPQAAHAQEVRTRIALTGAPINGIRPQGNADYRVRTDKGRTRRRLEIQVRANLADGTIADVFVNGAPVGILTFAGGLAKLELENERGVQVPNVARGTTVVVSGRPAAAIVSGTF